MNFKEKALGAVRKIKAGEFATYSEMAEAAGNARTARAVGNVLAKNRDPKIPCHRVVRSDGTVGGYFGKESLVWKKLALLLQEGVAAVLPTDTIYGICGAALNKKTVEKIYELRKRRPDKPMIILISDLADLEKFEVRLSAKEKNILEKIWLDESEARHRRLDESEARHRRPAKISVILKCESEKVAYLHRGKGTLAFRMPKSAFLKKALAISGPLVAPSANREGEAPAETIAEARKYFGNKIVYCDGGKITGKPSALIEIKNGEIIVLRGDAALPKKLSRFLR